MVQRFFHATEIGEGGDHENRRPGGLKLLDQLEPARIVGPEHDVGDHCVEGAPLERTARVVDVAHPGARDRHVLESRAQRFAGDLVVFDEEHLALCRAAGSLRAVPVVAGLEVARRVGCCAVGPDRWPRRRRRRASVAL